MTFTSSHAAYCTRFSLAEDEPPFFSKGKPVATSTTRQRRVEINGQPGKTHYCLPVVQSRFKAPCKVGQTEMENEVITPTEYTAKPHPNTQLKQSCFPGLTLGAFINLNMEFTQKPSC
ncbi:hypothetical protein EYF80_012721 [Liparis tanakae]|uniref:Uncharacterized protein n=1 Tax=Liparis tanakae TaxID=230148 RepID=A0A4Z2IIT1_9TELE|nr:hypothetical protein EYF80_012721 [Liparis tanakae]